MSFKKEDKMKEKVFSGFLWKFSERIAAQVVSLVISIILARLLTTAEYGIITMVMIFITIANVFVSNGLGSALIQKKDANDLDFSSVFYINIAISLIIYLIIFMSSSVIADFFNMPMLSNVLKVLGIRIPVAAINSIQHAYVSRNMLFKKFFFSTLIGTIFSGIVGIVMAYKGYGVWALVFQYLTNTFMDTIVLWFTVRWRPILQCSIKRVGGLISFGWKLLISALLDTCYNQLRNLIIGKLYTANDLAYYNQGDKYPSLLVTNINSTISSVLFPMMSQYQDDRLKVKQLTRKAIQVSSFILWPTMVGLAIISEPLVKIILTEKWLPCVPFLQLFCFSYALWPIHTANLQAINAMGRSDLFLKLEFVKKSVGIVLLVLAVPYGPFMIAISLFLSSVLAGFINALPNIKLLNYSLREQGQDILSNLCLAIVMALFILPIKFIFKSDILLILVQIIVGSCVYIVLALITSNRSMQFLMNCINSKILNK